MRIIGVIAVLWAACGGDDGGPIPVDQFELRALQAECQYFTRCGLISDQSVCVALLQHTASDANLRAAVADGTVIYNADKAAECIAEFASRSCDPSAMSARVQPAACDEAAKGTVADNGACEISNQCLSGSCLTTQCTMACCPGTCNATPPPPAAIGQACATTGCVDGAYCATGTCAALLAASATCTNDDQCAYDTACIGPSGQQTCAKVPAAGDPCVQHGGTTLTCLRDGLACDTSMNKCATYLAKGAACSPTSTTLRCKADLACDASTMICGDLPAIGAACTSQCVVGSYCDGTTHTCTGYKADGAACTSNTQCVSDFCDPTPRTCGMRPVCG